MFFTGFKAMLPITTGVIPFGLVMGTVAFNAKMSFLQCMGMNIFVFAGAAQLAAVDLMAHQASIVVTVATGITINLRMMLYSAALSPLVKNSSLLIKLFISYAVTDQTYSALMASQKESWSKKDSIQFYIGASVCMILAWQAAVVSGFLFGDFAPKSLSLSFAVPLSFVALTLPSLKNEKYYLVALVSATLSIFLRDLSYNLGLLVSALVAICVGAAITRRKKRKGNG